MVFARRRLSLLVPTFFAFVGCFQLVGTNDFPAPAGGPAAGATNSEAAIPGDAPPDEAAAPVDAGAGPFTPVVAPPPAPPSRETTGGYTRLDLPVALPAVEREFRGAWIAAVSNIDWPSRRTLSTAEQQAELVAMLDAAVALNLNAVILHVRPAGDALYASELEPWSEYLTGTQGRAPEPFYDPLAFAVEAAHRRGLELHAWFNPYRARHPSARSAPAASHITRRRPDLVRSYGTHLWMDPSEPDVQAQALAVIVDVVRRYDVDGVHIDDYFYPYQERDRNNRLIPFPDDANYRRYREGGGTLARDDWRRSHVDSFVRRMYEAVRAEDPTVRVGISPFGIWRPNHPEVVRGLDAYRDLYADARKWLNEGWLDYMVPQLYWPVAAPQQPYTPLLRWWVEENRHGRHMWAGNIPNRVGPGEREWRPTEVIDQVRLTRAESGATGNVHFSMSTLLRNRVGVTDALRTSVYPASALPPATPWLDATVPAPPVVVIQPRADARATRLVLHTERRAGWWVVRQRFDGEWQTRILPGAHATLDVTWPCATPPEMIAVAAVSRTGVEGEAAVYER
jgi:uncharacterized lipoprotein YddW (UPF0748 family)